MNLANARIGQLLVPIEDFEKGVAFYRDVLGLQFLFSAPPQMAFFSCGAKVSRSGRSLTASIGLQHLNCGWRSSRIQTAISWHS